MHERLTFKAYDTSESFLLDTVSCDWPVRNTQRHWPEFHGSMTTDSYEITTNIINVSQNHIHNTLAPMKLRHF